MVGGAEAVVLLVIVALLFAPALVAFWLGYTVGKKRSSQVPPPPSPPTSPVSPVPPPPPAEEPHDD